MCYSHFTVGRMRTQSSHAHTDGSVVHIDYTPHQSSGVVGHRVTYGHPAQPVADHYGWLPEWNASPSEKITFKAMEPHAYMRWGSHPKIYGFIKTYRSPHVAASM